MATFVCQQCGNLHGAPVEACGVCGSPAVMLQPEGAAAAPAAPAVAGDLAVLVQKATALVDQLSELARVALANLPPKRDTQPPPAD